MTSTVYCVECDAPATPLPVGEAMRIEDMCSACLADRTTYCPRCGQRVYRDEILTVQTSRQTHWEPAEYEDCCVLCVPAEWDWE